MPGLATLCFFQLPTAYFQGECLEVGTAFAPEMVINAGIQRSYGLWLAALRVVVARRSIARLLIIVTRLLVARLLSRQLGIVFLRIGLRPSGATGRQGGSLTGRCRSISIAIGIAISTSCGGEHTESHRGQDKFFLHDIFLNNK